MLFEQIKNFCSPQEKALFGELLNLQKNLEMFEEMKGMMQLFETLRESAPDADADTAADADCSGTNPDAGYTKAAARTGSETDTAAGQATSAFDSASASLTGTTTFPDNFDPMTFLKGMLSPEQQAMFEAFRDGL